MFLQIIDRRTAKAAGLKHYFTGMPCSRGGIAERLVSSATCLCKACKDYKRAYKQANPEIIQGQNKRYRERYAEKIREKRKIQHQENRETNNARKNIWRQKNAEYNRLYLKQWRAKNKENIRAYNKNYFEANREKCKSLNKKWREQNPELDCAKTARRKSSKLSATPLWYGEIDDFVLQEAYLLCQQRKETTGFNWHVDHMIPLQARSVCGLHVWNNFQVMPANMNVSKRNRLIYTQPHEWLHDIPKFFQVLQDPQAA